MSQYKQKPFERNELIKELSKEFERLNSTKYEDYQNNRKKHLPSGHRVRAQLGNISWSEVVKLTGHDPHSENWNKDKIIKLATSKNRQLTYKDLKKLGINADVVHTYFKSFKNFYNELGWKFEERIFYDHVTNEELLKEYEELSKNLGYAAKTSDIESHSEYPFELYRTRFGSLSDVRRLTGYEHRINPRSISKEDCMKEMLKLYEVHGRVAYDKLNGLLPFHIRTLLRKFGTTSIKDVWKEVIEEYEKR